MNTLAPCNKHSRSTCLSCDVDELAALRAEVEALKKPDCRVCQYSYRNNLACTQHPNCVNGNKFVRMSDVFTPLWRTE